MKKTEISSLDMAKLLNEENEWDGKVETDVLHGSMERVTMEEVKKKDPGGMIG
jgi:hypothetical protein